MISCCTSQTHTVGPWRRRVERHTLRSAASLKIGGCSVPRARNRIHCQPRRRLPGILRAHEPEDEEEAVEEVAVEEVVDPASLINSNPQFAAVFKSALQRTGPGVLNKGPPPDDPNKPSAAEEVLLQALRQSRRNLLRLEEFQKHVENAIEVETKQFERIQFSLKRATADAAFIRTLQKMRRERMAQDDLQ